MESAFEKVKLAVLASYDESGKINEESLKNNINLIDGIKSEISEIKYNLKLNVDGYEFEIFENGEIACNNCLDEEEIVASRGVGKESDVFSKVVVSKQSNNQILIQPEFKEGKKSSDVYTYIIVINEKIYGQTSELSCKLENLLANTEYDIYIIAIDKYAGLLESNKLSFKTENFNILDYPVITADGIYNAYIPSNEGNKYIFIENLGSTTASDSIDIKAYDRKFDTRTPQYDLTYKYLKIDPSAVGKKITISRYNGFIGYIFGYSTGSPGYDLVGYGRSDLTLIIPEGQNILGIYSNEGASISELSVE